MCFICTSHHFWTVTHILIIYRNHDLCTDEEPKYKKKVTDVFVRGMEVLNGGGGQV